MAQVESAEQLSLMYESTAVWRSVLVVKHGGEVGAGVGIAVGFGVMHVSTAQKGPFVEVGVVLLMHPELVKMSVFVMDGIVVFHEHKFWLNADASANIKAMVVTEPTFHPEMSWLNADAPANMRNMFVTKPTVHPEMSWLKSDAYSNIYDMSVTEPTFHPEMSWLNADVALNI